MSYKVLPFLWFGHSQERDHEKVGIYLQYLPTTTTTSTTTTTTTLEEAPPVAVAVDASFALRLLGGSRQALAFSPFLPETNNAIATTTASTAILRRPSRRRVDLEFRSGMRFVDLSHTKLADGQANDFGAHLLPTASLGPFLGVRNDDDDNEPVQIKVSIEIHGVLSSSSTNDVGQRELLPVARLSGWKLFDRAFADIRQGEEPIRNDQEEEGASTIYTSSHNRYSIVRERVRTGRIVVPLLRRLSERPRMFQLGVYPGVEYRILRIADPSTDQDVFYHQPGADYELKPIYPLVSQLERPWPVRVNERDIPTLYTSNMYNAVSAIGSLFTAVTGLGTAFLISQAISLFFIPSRSMDPTLQVGDVLLVDKVTPRLFQTHHRGEIVLFHPPERLQEIVNQRTGNGGGASGLSDRDLFVKRVAAEPGDRFQVVDKKGTVRVNGNEPSVRRDLCTAEPLRLIEQYIQPTSEKDGMVIGKGSVAVLGDCSSVSIDSRVWGLLSNRDIVGRPIARIWPLSRFGTIPDLPPSLSTTMVDTPTQENHWE